MFLRVQQVDGPAVYLNTDKITAVAEGGVYLADGETRYICVMMDNKTIYNVAADSEEEFLDCLRVSYESKLSVPPR